MTNILNVYSNDSELLFDALLSYFYITFNTNVFVAYPIYTRDGNILSLVRKYSDISIGVHIFNDDNTTLYIVLYNDITIGKIKECELIDILRDYKLNIMKNL